MSGPSAASLLYQFHLGAAGLSWSYRLRDSLGAIGYSSWPKQENKEQKRGFWKEYIKILGGTMLRLFLK